MSIPFKLVQDSESATAWVTEVEGTLSLEDDEIIIEYRRRDAVVGAWKSSIRELNLEISDLKEIESKRGWFNDVIILRARKMSSVSDLSNSNPNEIWFKVKKKFRNQTEQLTSTLRYRLSEIMLDEIDKL